MIYIHRDMQMHICGNMYVYIHLCVYIYVSMYLKNSD